MAHLRPGRITVLVMMIISVATLSACGLFQDKNTPKDINTPASTVTYTPDPVASSSSVAVEQVTSLDIEYSDKELEDIMQIPRSRRYESGGNIYYIKTDTGPIMVLSKPERKINTFVKDNVIEFILVKDKVIFLTEQYTAPFENVLYLIDLDGKNKTEIDRDVLDILLSYEDELYYEKQVSPFVIYNLKTMKTTEIDIFQWNRGDDESFPKIFYRDDEWFYFTRDHYGGGSGEGAWYSRYGTYGMFRTGFSEYREMADFRCFSPNKVGDWVYFIDVRLIGSSFNGYLYRMKLDMSNRTKLSEKECLAFEDFRIDNGYVYYLSASDGALHKVNLNNTSEDIDISKQLTYENRDLTNTSFMYGNGNKNDIFVVEFFNETVSIYELNKEMCILDKAIEVEGEGLNEPDIDIFGDWVGLRYYEGHRYLIYNMENSKHAEIIDWQSAFPRILYYTWDSIYIYMEDGTIRKYTFN